MDKHNNNNNRNNNNRNNNNRNNNNGGETSYVSPGKTIATVPICKTFFSFPTVTVIFARDLRAIGGHFDEDFVPVFHFPKSELCVEHPTYLSAQRGHASTYLSQHNVIMTIIVIVIIIVIIIIIIIFTIINFALMIMVITIMFIIVVIIKELIIFSFIIIIIISNSNNNNNNIDNIKDIINDK